MGLCNNGDAEHNQQLQKACCTFKDNSAENHTICINSTFEQSLNYFWETRY